MTGMIESLVGLYLIGLVPLINQKLKELNKDD